MLQCVEFFFAYILSFLFSLTFPSHSFIISYIPYPSFFLSSLPHHFHSLNLSFPFFSLLGFLSLILLPSFHPLTEMWYGVFLWTAVSSLMFHLPAALLALFTLRQHKMARFMPIAIVLMGVLGPLTGGVLTSELLTCPILLAWPLSFMVWSSSPYKCMQLFKVYRCLRHHCSADCWRTQVVYALQIFKRCKVMFFFNIYIYIMATVAS